MEIGIKEAIKILEDKASRMTRSKLESVFEENRKDREIKSIKILVNHINSISESEEIIPVRIGG